MFCQYCGKELPDQAKFCPSCGGACAEPEKKAAPAAKKLPAPPLIMIAAAVLVLLVCAAFLMGRGMRSASVSAGQTSSPASSLSADSTSTAQRSQEVFTKFTDLESYFQQQELPVFSKNGRKPTDLDDRLYQVYDTQSSNASSTQQLLEQYISDCLAKENFSLRDERSYKEEDGEWGFYALDFTGQEEVTPFIYNSAGGDFSENCDLVLYYRDKGEGTMSIMCVYANELAQQENSSAPAQPVSQVPAKEDPEPVQKEEPEPEPAEPVFVNDGTALPDLQSFSGNRLEVHSQSVDTHSTKVVYFSDWNKKFFQEYLDLLQNEYGFTLREYKQIESIDSHSYVFDHTGGGDISGFDCTASGIKDGDDVELFIWGLFASRASAEIHVEYSDGLKYVDTGDRTTQELSDRSQSGSSSSGGSDDSIDWGTASGDWKSDFSYCGKCHNKGEITCTSCNGNGGKYVYSNSTPNYSGTAAWSKTGQTWETCRKCGGSGTIDCPNC